MCSIAGVCSKSGKGVSRQLFQLLSTTQHRGPQAFGVKTPEAEKKVKTLKALLPLPESYIALGHCLLSTTGFGVQPLSSGNVSIAHNGQIYNFEQLNSSGKKLSSDSEVIAHFFSERLASKPIEKVLKEFMLEAEGEYAVGLLHGEKLYAFRDVLGLKPVWFGENDSLCAFASEPHALMKLDMQFPQPLPPGHLLEISPQGLRVEKIFSLEDFRKTVPEKYSPEKLKSEFEKAISMQTQGLKKAAVLFSGGVDSSLVAKAVSEKVSHTKLFVAGVKGSPDVEYAKKAAKELGLELEIVSLDEKKVSSLAFRAMKILSFFDEMQVSIAVPELACAEQIKEQGFKVVFSGQGSDEIFAGYSNYAKALKEQGFEGVEEEIWLSLSRMWSRNFYRDDAILARNSLELRVPFVALNFLREALAFPAREKILSENDALRKHPLRALARSYGIPEPIASKPKHAMQYGSGAQKIVSKLFRGS